MSPPENVSPVGEWSPFPGKRPVVVTLVVLYFWSRLRDEKRLGTYVKFNLNSVVTVTVSKS